MARASDGAEVRTLRHAWREFRRYRSPWVIGASIVATLVARAALGGAPTWRDAVAVAGIVVIYPFGEWSIHVYLLHAPRLRWRGREVELATTASHRAHHEAPSRLGMVLLGPAQAVALLFLAVPVVVGGGGLLVAALAPGGVPWAALLSAVVAGQLLVGVYEWCHFVIHTAHRPRSRWFRAVARGHRLHHYKNEHFWHGITTTVGDRVLGTMPDHRDVERSPTARSLIDVTPQ